MIKDKDYLDFKEKYDELVNIFNIASIVEVACLARESVDKIQQCASTIVNKGKILSKILVWILKYFNYVKHF